MASYMDGAGLEQEGGSAAWDRLSSEPRKEAGRREQVVGKRLSQGKTTNECGKHRPLPTSLQRQETGR